MEKASYVQLFKLVVQLSGLWVGLHQMVPSKSLRVADGCFVAMFVFFWLKMLLSFVRFFFIIFVYWVVIYFCTSALLIWQWKLTVWWVWRGQVLHRQTGSNTLSAWLFIRTEMYQVQRLGRFCASLKWMCLSHLGKGFTAMMWGTQRVLDTMDALADIWHLLNL